MILQTLAAVWWASGISHDVTNIKSDIVYLKAQMEAIANTRASALETFATLNAQVQRQADHNADQDRRLGEVESRMREVERKIR